MLYLLTFIFIQIVFESLPISSSAHLILLNKFFGYFDIPIDILPYNFDYFLHGAQIIIICYVFYDQWRNPAKLFINSLIKFEFNDWKIKQLLAIVRKLLLFGFLVELITLSFYFFHSYLVKRFNLFENPYLLSVCFLITALSLLLTAFKKNHVYKSLDVKLALGLGFVQGLAFFSGISRFAITYSLGILANLSPRRAFEISFLIELPLCIGGFFIGLHSLVGSENLYLIYYFPIISFIILATLLSAYLFKRISVLARNNKLWIFSFYFIVPILLLIFL